MRSFLAALAALVVLPYDQRVATRWGETQAYAQLRGHPLLDSRARGQMSRVRLVVV